MAGLQRSSETFRRSGSSGLVWEDRFLSEELNQGKKGSEEEGGGGGAVASSMERSRSNGGRGGYRTVGRISPALDPPSPRVSVCGFCGFFGKPNHNNPPNPKTNKRR
ncbi:uncharacterized protein At1g15400-like [Typha angustifolia]|uniref:uncharacterized protein At1g15400-like n=1 Tax=Typha angustifolia TaxID=59011 RepID=UPI003C2D66C2